MSTIKEFIVVIDKIPLQIFPPMEYYINRLLLTDNSIFQSKFI